jgi:hypothetical protein
MRFRSPRFVQSPLSFMEMRYLLKSRAPTQQWPICQSHSVSSKFLANVIKQNMRSSSDVPSSEPRCGFLPYLLQVRVTQHSSVSIVQLTFGHATSRPHAHAVPEGPQPSFWGYVGHWNSSGRCFPTLLSFVSFVSSHSDEPNMMPYLKPVISHEISAKPMRTNVTSIQWQSREIAMLFWYSL